MLTKKSAAGIGIGLVAVVLGTFFLLQTILSNVHDVNDTVDIGKHFINITNAGGSILHVTGKLEAVTNPIIFTSHLIVISSGVLIIGISAAFSIRRPKGF